MSHEERIARSRMLTERAMFNGEFDGLAEADRELDAMEADLALARGRVVHTRFLDERVEDEAEIPLFERAAELYRSLGDARGEGEAMFWVGLAHQVVRDDAAAALPALRRSRELAEQTGDKLTLSYALRHLGFAEHQARELSAARALLEESTRLRRELDFVPGVAANLVGLAYIADDEGRGADAVELLKEAAALAEASGAHAIQGWVDDALGNLGKGD